MELEIYVHNIQILRNSQGLIHCACTSISEHTSAMDYTYCNRNEAVTAASIGDDLADCIEVVLGKRLS